jgi:hypothetical protein
MLRRNYLWLAAVIAIVAVTLVFVAPSVDLEPTALRAWQAACAVFVAMALISRAVAALASPTVFLNVEFPFFLLRNTPLQKSSENTCVLLC